MKANYHTHTWRCRHAKGTERQYIEQAIQSGMKTLGFSDHNPCPFPGTYYSSYRMTLDLTEDYFRTMTDLKAEYKGQIDLHIGFEAEYYPAIWNRILDYFRQYPCEYLLLGQHFLDNELDTRKYVYIPSSKETELIQYVDQTLEALDTGLFTYLAHPDLFFWTGQQEIYAREMTRLCQEAKKRGTVLEFNLLGFYDSRNYPSRAFWDIAAEVGNSVILGCDAHEPEALNRPETEAAARTYLDHLGITPIDTIALRPI